MTGLQCARHRRERNRANIIKRLLISYYVPILEYIDQHSDDKGGEKELIRFYTKSISCHIFCEFVTKVHRNNLFLL